jgi:hypothetical protein
LTQKKWATNETGNALKAEEVGAALGDKVANWDENVDYDYRMADSKSGINEVRKEDEHEVKEKQE